MIKEIPYQQRVLLAAFELTKNYAGSKGYEILYNQNGLFVIPLTYNSKGEIKWKSMPIRVTDKEMIGSKQDVGELERILRKQK
jgi:hypothetical protein